MTIRWWSFAVVTMNSSVRLASLTCFGFCTGVRPESLMYLHLMNLPGKERFDKRSSRGATRAQRR
jgi:hypothetical protein